MLTKKKKKAPKINLSTASNISLHSSFDNAEYETYSCQFLYLFNLCILRENYKNFVALVYPEVFELQKNPNFNITYQEEFIHSKPFGICLIENKFYYLGEEDPSNFIKLLHILEKRPERYIIIYVQNTGDSKKEAHANIIILDTIIKGGYYFEPHGIKIYFLNQAKQNELGKLFKDAGYDFYFPNEYYYRPKYLEHYGFQNMDSSDSVVLKSAKPGKLDAKGYCFYWCMYFINMVIKYPHLSINNLFKQLFLLLGRLGKKDFHRHIRTYAQRQEKAAKERYADCYEQSLTGLSGIAWGDMYIKRNDCKKKMFLEYYKVFNYKYGKYKLQ